MTISQSEPDESPSINGLPSYLGTAIPIMDPIQKRRMQNRVAQRNHRQKVKENKNREKQRKEALCQDQQEAQASEIPQEVATEPNLAVGSKDMSNDHVPEFKNPQDGEFGHGRPFLREPFSISQTPFGHECEIGLDSMLDKHMNDYQYTMIAGEHLMPGQLSEDATRMAEHLSMFDPEASESSDPWNFSPVIGPFQSPIEEMKSFLPISQQCTTTPGIAPLTCIESTPPVIPWSSYHTQSGDHIRAARASRQTVNSASSGVSCRSNSQKHSNGKPPLHRQSASSIRSWSPSTPTDASLTSHEFLEQPNLSARYQLIIDCVRRAGFETVDAMISGYYTSSFEKNSVADRAQKASRTKHLRTVLSSLHEHSREWTTWEFRGFRDQIVEAAEGIYGAEFGRLAQRLEKKRRRVHRSASTTSQDDKATSSGSSSYEYDDPSFNESGSAKKTDETSMEQTLSQKSLKDLQRLYQNKLPNVWALLTEMGGGSAAQAEDAAVVAASLLYYTRTNPRADLKELLLRMIDSLELSPERYD